MIRPDVVIALAEVLETLLHERTYRHPHSLLAALAEVIPHATIGELKLAVPIVLAGADPDHRAATPGALLH